MIIVDIRLSAIKIRLTAVEICTMRIRYVAYGNSRYGLRPIDMSSTRKVEIRLATIEIRLMAVEICAARIRYNSRKRELRENNY